MWKNFLCSAALLGAAATALAQPSAADFASLTEQIRDVNEQAGQLALRVETLERDNARLRAQNDTLTQNLAAANRAGVTAAQLNAAVASLQELVKSTDQATRDQVAAQIKKLAEQTNTALDAIAKGQQPTRPADPTPTTTPPVFSDNYPKEGIAYTVQSGDSLAKIAQKTGAKQADIINANKIANPSKLQAGQKLFIPGGKTPATP